MYRCSLSSAHVKARGQSSAFAVVMLRQWYLSKILPAAKSSPMVGTLAQALMSIKRGMSLLKNSDKTACLTPRQLMAVNSNP